LDASDLVTTSGPLWRKGTLFISARQIPETITAYLFLAPNHPYFQLLGKARYWKAACSLIT
jgi:hypothetical protein